MKQFYKDFGFIIGFLVMTLVVEMALGEKAQFYFLLLVLLSMMVLNADDFTSFVDEKFTLKTADEKQKLNATENNGAILL